MAGSVIGNIAFIYTKNIVLSLIISFIVHISVLLFLVKKIRKIYLIFLEKEEMGSWLQLCLIPAFYYCTFTFLIYFPHTLYENDDNALGIIFLLITMFISYVVVFRYGENEMKRNDMYMKNVLFEYYIKGLESQYDFIENAERNLKILRHDMRHYTGMIDSLLEQKQYNEIKKITEHVNQITAENKIVKYCDNLKVNTIFYNMMKRASSFDIDVNIDALIPEELPVNDYELASVVANLLENSLMYVKNLEKNKRYVNMMIHYENKSLSLKIENECEEELVFDSTTGLPVSKKGKGHGYGMQSISVFADKIGGSLGCYCENGIFTVMLFAKNLI